MTWSSNSSELKKEQRRKCLHTGCMHVSTGALLPVMEADKLSDQSEWGSRVQMCVGQHRLFDHISHAAYLRNDDCIVVWLRIYWTIYTENDHCIAGCVKLNNTECHIDMNKSINLHTLRDCTKITGMGWMVSISFEPSPRVKQTAEVELEILKFMTNISKLWILQPLYFRMKRKNKNKLIIR